MQTVERHDLARHALRSPRGRYGAERASQLSGVPRSTIYDWQRDRVLVPDYPDADPMQWSYRDLVLLRLLARMRERGVPRPKASAAVATVRDLLSDPGSEVRHVRLGPALLLDENFPSPPGFSPEALDGDLEVTTLHQLAPGLGVGGTSVRQGVARPSSCHDARMVGRPD